MLTKNITVKPSGLQIGDQFWGDPPYAHDWADPESSNRTDFAFKVIGEPSTSVNMALFGSNVIIVVPVEYLDGARGSRLYDPETEITVRRPS